MSDSLPKLAKSPTGIEGLDEITEGGLPEGRPTLIAGNAGCGKTLLAMEFLIKGAQEYNEPGVFVAFEETPEDLYQNVASLGYDLPDLIKRKQIYIDHILMDRSEIEETGEYDLEGLFIRLGHAIDTIGAKRVVLDTLEALFSSFTNTAVLRSELRRLFHWLKDRGVTAIITGERGETTLTRQGLEEYVSDCVIVLDHRIEEQISTRRLRIVKYRGSTHGTNEYPFIIDADGISVLPITSLRLEHSISSKRVSTGIPPLDLMLGSGFYKGSTILLSGTAGTGKTSIATSIAAAACKRGERVIYFAFEESPLQIIRNAKSIGVDLEAGMKSGNLHFEAIRSYSLGLEMHLVTINKLLANTKPDIVIVDPITNLITAGNIAEVRAMLTRLMDMLKSTCTTGIFTSLTQGGENLELTDFGVSSLVDTWMLLRNIETDGERNRGLYVLKSRGTAHSNQIREFLITNKGVDLQDVYLGAEGLLTGSARLAAEARDVAAREATATDLMIKQRQLSSSQAALRAQIASLNAQLEVTSAESDALVKQELVRQETAGNYRQAMIKKRGISPNA